MGAGPTTRNVEKVLLVEALEELRLANVTQTETLARLRSHILNQVLASGLYLLDANGLATDSYVTPYGSLTVANHGTADVTVTSAGPQSQAPGLGKGVARVPAGTFRVVNFSGTEWTLYGAAGALCTVEAFVRPQPPAAGRIAGTFATPGAGADGAAGASIPEVALGAVNSAGNIDRLRFWNATNGGFTLSAAQPSADAPAAVSATNAAASIVFGAPAGSLRNRLVLVAWSYSAAAAAGRLTVSDGATVIVDQDLITGAAANGQLVLPPGGIRGTAATAMTVTLAAGGVGNVGKISAAVVVA